jgi:hypothetical protein
MTKGLFQQAYLVRDLEAACRQWSELLGAGPFQLVPHHRTERFDYRGMYAPGQQGFHHIGIPVSDFEAEIDRYESAGFEVACRLFADDVDAAYIDTRSVTGGFTEIHGNPPHILRAFERWRRAHAAWQPGDDHILRP